MIAVVPVEKECRCCGIWKPLSEFHGNRKQADGKGLYCKSCLKPIYQRIRKKRRENGKTARYNRSRYSRSRDVFLKKKFGISSEQYNVMFEKQKGLCAICGRPEAKRNRHGRTYTLSVDHDHETDQVRGLLCSNCNYGLGYFEDNIESMTKGIEYLEFHRKSFVFP